MASVGSDARIPNDCPLHSSVNSLSPVLRTVSTQNVRLDCDSRCIARRQIFPEIMGTLWRTASFSVSLLRFAFRDSSMARITRRLDCTDWIREKAPSSSLPPFSRDWVLQCEVRRPEGRRPKRNQIRFGRCILLRYDCRTARLRTGSPRRGRCGNRQSGYPRRLPRGSNKFGALRWGLRCRLLPNDRLRCSLRAAGNGQADPLAGKPPAAIAISNERCSS